MQNARSYFGRFSGLALFLLAILVVGLLVALTIKSANDNDSSTDDGMTSSESTEQEPVALPDLDSTPAVTNTDDSTAVAGDEDGLPNTGPADALVPAAVLGLLAWQAANYLSSRQDLKRLSRARQQ